MLHPAVHESRRVGEPGRAHRRRPLVRALACAAGIGALVAGAASAHAAAPPSMSVSASPGYYSSTVYITTPVTITVHLSSTLTGTPYFVRLYDATTGRHVGADCVSGTTCTRTVTSGVAGTHSYVAHLDQGKGGPPPFHTVAAAHLPYSFTWINPPVSLSSTWLGIPSATAADGWSMKLTAQVPISLTNTGLFLRIVDTATNSAVSSDCATGTSCTATVNGSDTTHTYAAHLDSGYGGAPPFHTVSSSHAVPLSWTSTSWRVSLTQPSGYDYVQASANGDITTTPYWIYIFDARTHALTSKCSQGTICGSVAAIGDPMVAFISSYSATPTFPPAGTVASSTEITPHEMIH